MAESKLDAAAAGVSEHQTLLRVLNYAITVDQLDVSQLACMELVCRRTQLTELKCRVKFISHCGSIQDPVQDAHLYLGQGTARRLLCISPVLEKFVGDQLGAEAVAAKERREAHEERLANKTPNPANK